MILPPICFIKNAGSLQEQLTFTEHLHELSTVLNCLTLHGLSHIILKVIYFADDKTEAKRVNLPKEVKLNSNSGIVVYFTIPSPLVDVTNC